MGDRALEHARIEAEPLPDNLGALLDDAVRRFGDRPAWIAVDSDPLTITWSELGERVARAANAFRRLGVGKRTHVGVMLPNTPEALVAWLALARLGAWMIPINPAYTPKELRYWLTDGEAEWLLITAAALDVYRAMQAEEPVLAPERLAISGGPPESGMISWDRLTADASPLFAATETVLPDDIVNIQYTSGSTGLPKGCLLSHRYWMQIGKLFAEVWPRFDRIQCDLPFYYMGPLWRFAVAAFTGAALCVPPAYSLSRFRERIRDGGYDMSWMTNPVAMLPPDPIERDHRLKMIAVFGLAKDLHRPLEERYGVPVREAFGMTEVGFTIYMPLDAAHMSGSGSCGITTPFRELMIADPTGKPLPPGETGELCIRGLGIMQGYHKKPEATAAAFHGDWFRTGDLFRQDAEGYFTIVGRIKDMIRRSAENISAAEVEAVLSMLPMVQEAAVHAVPDAKRGEEVKACLMLPPGVTPEMLPSDVVIAHCRAHLAPFKVPRYVQFYREFPRTGSDKVAKRRLIAGEGEPLGPVVDQTHAGSS